MANQRVSPGGLASPEASVFAAHFPANIIRRSHPLGEPRSGEGREEPIEGGVGTEPVAGGGLLPEGGSPPVLGATGQEVRDRIARRLDQASRGVGDQDAPTDGQDAGGAPGWSAGLLRRDDHVGSAGGAEQQAQDDEAASLWVPGP